LELAANGTNCVGFKSPDSITANVIWTLPSADGGAGQVLSTNGTGTLSWAIAGGSQTPWTSNINAAGYTLNGNSIAGGNLTLDSTSNGTKGYVLLSPTGGRVGIGTTVPNNTLQVADLVNFNNALTSTYLGYQAGNATSTATDSLFVGYQAGLASTTGDSNTALGPNALRSVTWGGGNTMVGKNAGYSIVTGSNNVGVGSGVFGFVNGGNYNVAVGRSALAANTANGNIAIGDQAGDNLTTGSRNIVIGYQIDSPTATNDRTLTIGNLIYGTGVDGTGTTVSTGNVGIGVIAPAEKLTVAGNIAVSSVGNGLKIAEGANAKMGTATLVAGTVTVNTTAVTANSRIFLTAQTLGTIARPAAVGVTARTAGVAFTITSGDVADTSTVAWLIVEPN
jgi:hypothetical protein